MMRAIRVTTVVAIALGFLPIAARAQVPNAAAAIAVAKDARAKTEAAQKKNAEALDPAPAPAPPQAKTPPAPGSAAPPAQPTGPATAGYTYDPNGRRDPFVSLTGRGGDFPSAGASRPAGLAGLLVNEVTVKGVLKSGKGGFIALIQGPDNRTYIVHTGDKVLDGAVKAINQDEVVFSQDVNDPLSLVKQREVRKSIHPVAR